MTGVPDRVSRLCAEFGVRIIDRHRYPGPRETRAVETLARILRRYGEGHLRLVLSTLTETGNNHACLDETALWAASDMIRACPEIVERKTSAWLDMWDHCPVGELQFVAQDLRGIIPLRYALGGMIYERVARSFGPRSIQPDLFDERLKRW